MATIYEEVELLKQQMTQVQNDITALQNASSNQVTDLTEGTDILTLALGEYLIPNAAIAASLLNKPATAGNSTGTISVLSGGSDGQKTIIYKTCSKTVTTYYERAYYGNSWGEWNTVLGTDSGWLNLPLANGISAHNATSFPCEYRKINNVVYVRGCVTGFSDVEKVIATLPEGYRPSTSFYIQRATNGGKTDTINVRTNGNIERVSTTLPTLAADNYHFIDVSFLVD